MKNNRLQEQILLSAAPAQLFTPSERGKLGLGCQTAQHQPQAVTKDLRMDPLVSDLILLDPLWQHRTLIFPCETVLLPALRTWHTVCIIKSDRRERLCSFEQGLLSK